ncbi:Premnaspirodiene oxygenase [Platanthera guangdongensis]|uniref:Premnaspirodiene oxygenase n=1 Tax=Platanthera guangdongensis TaxID=2320717 RepID=A0ABR2LVN9_9ASPA
MESSLVSPIYPQLLSIIFLILLLIKILLWLGKNAGGGSGKYNLPPGPWRLPIIGSMHHLIGEHPHRRLSRLAETYGPLLHLKLGEVDLITISSPEVAREVMKTHDLTFASRPQMLVGDIIFYHNSDILFSPHGKYWSQLRKICMMNFFSPKQVKSSGFIRKEETSILVEQIRAAAELGEPINLSKQFFLVANSIVTREAFGKECGHRESFFEAIRVITKLVSGFNIADAFPSMGFLGVITGLRRKAVGEHIHMDSILNTIIQEHLARRAQRNDRAAAAAAVEDDIVDVLLNIKERGECGELDVPLTMDNIKAVILMQNQNENEEKRRRTLKINEKTAARDGRGNENKEPTCAPSKSYGCCTSNHLSEASQPTGDGRGSDSEAGKCGVSCGERGGGRGDRRGNDREAGRCSGSGGEFGLRISKLDLFVAGTETASGFIDWIMTELIRHPEAMQKAQLEVRKALNGTTKIKENDSNELQYLHCVIKETLRLHPPAPLLVPRTCSETVELSGYTIPAKSRIIINVGAIMRDPKYWKNPESFCPERFQGSNLDFKGTQFEYFPFGSGRRICPGITFALANIEEWLTQILLHFDWSMPDGKKPEDLDMEEDFGGTVIRKNHLCLLATPRR